MKILIAEDDATSREILAHVLRQLGHEVVEAANGEQAWAVFQQEHVPLLISDWMMPGLDGLQLCRRIRAERRPRYTYIILLTVLGLVWRHLRLGARASRVAAVAGAVSLYAIWIGFVLAAGLGTGRATPMAAAGRHGEPWQETLVSSVLGAGSAALVVAILAVLWGLRAARASRE